MVRARIKNAHPAAYFRRILGYDPNTGALAWLTRPPSMFPKGSGWGVWNKRYAGKEAGSLAKDGYINIRVSGVCYRAHRLAWLIYHGGWPKNEIDHINGDRSDNRIANLRDVSPSENQRNKGQARPIITAWEAGRSSRPTWHGLSKSKLHRRWTSIRQRCRDPNVPRYRDYGGRGIYVCEEWENFEPFMRWALANGYRDDLQIDRIDNDGPYAPWNCRWVTPAENAANTRQSRIYDFNGERLCVSQAARKYGLNVFTLFHRLNRGVPPEEAIKCQTN